MYIVPAIRRTTGKTYRYFKLVESVRTEHGPRQRTIMSLGKLEGLATESIKLLAQLIDSRLSGQIRLLPAGADDARLGTQAERIAECVLRKRSRRSLPAESVTVRASAIEAGEARLLGPLVVGLEQWKALELDRVLSDCGFSPRRCTLAMLQVLGRLVEPGSEVATSGWIERSGASDLLAHPLRYVNKDALYRVSDALWAARERIEAHLSGAERRLFALEEAMVLVDLTSTYFEGLGQANPKARRGYSRDHRGDCPQMVVGMVLDEAGFPKASETWRGDTADSRTLESMLDGLERRCGKRPGVTAVMDRGIATQENVALLKGRGYHYVVALASQSRRRWIGEIRQADFQTLEQAHPDLQVCQMQKDGEVYLLVRSDRRIGKDRAIRERFTARLEAGLERLAAGVASGRLSRPQALQKLGALRQRYSRASRFFLTELAEPPGEAGLTLRWSIDEAKRGEAELLDGVYILKTDREDLDSRQLWSLYMMLARVERSFRYLKTSLGIRPIFHQLQRRADGHIFISILAYHLLHGIEQRLLAHGDRRSWPTVKAELDSHRVLTVKLPDAAGRVHQLRVATTPTAAQREIYRMLGLKAKPLPSRYHVADQERSAENESDALSR